MFGRIFFSTLLIMIFECWLLWKLVFACSFFAVFLWCVATFLLGISTLRMAAQRIQGGRVNPTQGITSLPHTVVDGVLLSAAGVFLLLPGVLTDLFGLLLWLPPVRSIAAKKIGKAAWIQQAQWATFQHPFGGGAPGTSGHSHTAQGSRKDDDEIFSSSPDDQYAPPSSQRPDTVILDAEIIDSD